MFASSWSTSGPKPRHVGGAVGELAGDDHLRLSVDDRLAVVALVEALVRRLHDLRVGVGEVALRLRPRFGRLLVVLARAALALSLRPRLGRERRLRLLDRAKAPLAA